MEAIKIMITKICEVAKVGGAAIVSFFQGASVATLIKFGLIAGLTIGAIILVIKFIKSKINSYHENARRKNVTERALDLNYYDRRNSRKLKKQMNMIKKELNHYTEKRAKKKKDAINRRMKRFGKFGKKFPNLCYELSKDDDDDYGFCEGSFFTRKNNNDSWGSTLDRLYHDEVNSDLNDYIDSYEYYDDDRRRNNSDYNHSLVDMWHNDKLFARKYAY